MPKMILDHANVGAGIDQVKTTGVPKGVGMPELRRNSSLRSVALDQHVYHPARDRAVPCAGVGGAQLRRSNDKE